MVRVKLIFDAQFCGYVEMVVGLPDADQATIEKAFIDHMGILMDDNCDYEILD